MQLEEYSGLGRAVLTWLEAPGGQDAVKLKP